MGKMSVLHNEFEVTHLQLTGQGYAEAVTLEGLPPGVTDELTFENLDLLADSEEGRVVSFSLKSHVKEAMRFTFEDHPDFSFVPNIGHIRPGKTKAITATFCPAADSLDPDTGAVEHKQTPVALTLQAFTYVKPETKTDEEIEALIEEERETYTSAVAEWKAKKKKGLEWDTSMKI